jgi:hypothetical protein
LATTPVGEVCTYDALSDAIGRPVRPVRHMLMQALAKARKEHGAVFGTVTRIGYRRLSAEEVHTLGRQARQRVRRTTRRARESIATALSRANEISEPARLKAVAELAALGLLEQIAADKAQPPPPEGGKVEPVAVTARKFLARLTGEPAQS